MMKGTSSPKASRVSRTNVLVILPGTVDNRIQNDLNVEYTVRDEYISKFQPYIEALQHYNFLYAYWVDAPRSDMEKFAAEIVRDWPNIAYAIYLDQNSIEGVFYSRDPFHNKGNVSVDQLMAELDRLGVPSTPIEMDYEDEYDDPRFCQISIRSLYQKSLELITSIPRVLYRSGKLTLPNTDIWLANSEREIIRYLSKKPDKVFGMTPREFEKLIASIFRANNYDVELTPATRDGGFDVLAVQRSDLTGDNRFLVECKRYAPRNKVGIGLVQRLIGTVNQFKATRGILVTTSSFTRDALDCVKSTAGIVTVKDYESIVGWLRDIAISTDETNGAK